MKCEQLVAAFAGTNPNKSQALSAADIVKVEATSTLSIKFFESLTATVLFKCSISLLYHFCQAAEHQREAEDISEAHSKARNVRQHIIFGLNCPVIEAH